MCPHFETPRSTRKQTNPDRTQGAGGCCGRRVNCPLLRLGFRSSIRHAASTAGDGLYNRAPRNSAGLWDDAFYGRQAGQLWDLRFRHRRFAVVMLRASAFRHVDLAHLRRRRLPRLAHLGPTRLPLLAKPVFARRHVCRSLCPSTVGGRWGHPSSDCQRWHSGRCDAGLLMANLLPGFRRSCELDGSNCHVNAFKGRSGWRGSAGRS